MAGNTLFSLLIKLGFDISELQAGGAAATRTLGEVGAAVGKVGAMAAPSAAALDAVAKAAEGVAGSRGGVSALNNLAQGLAAISKLTGGSAAGMEAFAKAAERISTSTGSGAALNAFSRAAFAVVKSTGSSGALVSFAKAIGDIAANSKDSGQVIAFARAEAEAAEAAFAAAGSLNGFTKAQNAAAAATKSAQTQTTNAASATASFTAAARGAGAGAQTAAAGMNAQATAAANLARQLSAAVSAAGGQGRPQTARPMGPNVGAPWPAGATGTGAPAGAGMGGGGGGAAGGGGGGGGAGGGPGNVAGGLNATAGAANNAARQVNNLGNAISNAATRGSFLNRVLSMAFAFSGGVAVTTVIGFITNAVIGFNSRLEQAHIAFTTLLGDAGAADAFIMRMKKFADVTPFDFQSLEEATQRLMAMGFSAEQVLPVLKVVGDTVSGLGGSVDKIDRITIALGQMSTAGKVNAQDMRQLTEAGIPAWAMLAEGIGKSVQETRNLAEKGLIPANQALAILLEGMDAKFRGLMEKQAHTAAGAFTTIRDIALEVISGAVAPLYNAVSRTMDLMAQFFIAGGGRLIVPAIQAIGGAIAIFLIPKLIGLAATVYQTSIAFGAMSIPLLPLIFTLYLLGLAFQENIGGIREALGPVVTALGDFARTALQAAASTGLLVPIIEALAALIATKLIVNLAASAAWFAANAIASIRFGLSLTMLSVNLSAAAGPIGLLVAAFILLIATWDQVIQGIRVLNYMFRLLIAMLFEVLSKLPVVGDFFRGLANDAIAAASKMKDEILRIDKELKDKANATAGSTAAPDDLFANWDAKMKELVASFKGTADEAGAAAEMVKDKMKYNLAGVAEMAGKVGGDSMKEMAAGIKAAQDEPLQALIDLHNAMKTAMSQQAEINRLYGELQNKELAAGLESSDPAVRAQANAVVKLITERLDALTNGAYSAGENATTNLGNGLQSPKAIMALRNGMAATLAPLSFGLDKLFGTNIFVPVISGLIAGLGQTSSAQAALANAWDNDFKPSAEDAAKAANALTQYIADLDKENNSAKDSTNALAEALRQQAADAAYELGKAFDEVSEKAHAAFDVMHQGNLDQIKDARDTANAILKAKQDALQASVDTFNAQIDAERALRKEDELRKAVANAKDPAERARAEQELIDFLQDQEAKNRQADATAAINDLQAQIDHNTDLAANQTTAADDRYQAQLKAFDKELQALQAFLARHPEEWATMNASLLALLASYGIDYQAAGKTMGEAFAQGLKDSIATITAAAKEAFAIANAQAALNNVGNNSVTAGKPTLPSFEPGSVGVGGSSGGGGTSGGSAASAASAALSSTGAMTVGAGAVGGATGVGPSAGGNVQASGDLGGGASSAASTGRYVQSKLDATGVARLFLQMLGAPTSTGNVTAVATWLRAENSNPTKRNNPWNLHSSGGLPGQIDSVYVNKNDQNVAVFRTIEDGVRASVRNLQRLRGTYGKYGEAMDDLMANDPRAFLMDIAQSPWAASGYGLRKQLANGKWVNDPNGSNRLMGQYDRAMASYATGAWSLPYSQMAMVHAGEMILPAKFADSLRATLSGKGMDEDRQWSTLASTPANQSLSRGSDRRSSGGTLVVQIGEREFARFEDERMYIRQQTADVED